MKRLLKYKSWAGFVGGLLLGLLAYQTVLRTNGMTVVSKRSLERRQSELIELQVENHELTEDLFSYQVLTEADFKDIDLPYNEQEDARANVVTARTKAVEDKRFLMVTFGANWCQDCRTLHRNLHSEEVKDYMVNRFSFINVDVGKFNRNIPLAAELGVNLANGIPVAIFFDPDGRLIGTTNEGQLEPARRYSSKQILRFVRDVAEKSRILAPDQVQ